MNIKWLNKIYKHKTFKNKLVASLLMMVGIGSVFIDGDATGCLFIAILSICLFCEKENVINNIVSREKRTL